MEPRSNDPRVSTPGMRTTSQTSGTLHASTSGAGARIKGTPEPDHVGPGPTIMAASTLAGDKVVNQEGETLGDLDEIMIDVPRGRVAYGVLSAGGFLGLGEKRFAIPWNALTLDTDNKCFILDIDRERLRNAPGFDSDNWPTTPQDEWARNVHAYYKTQPYWD